MELKHWNTKISYKIEPNSSGGFVARSSDPSIAPIEASTMVEIQKKIQEQIVSSIGSVLPGLSIPLMFAEAAAAGAKTITQTVTSTTSNGTSVISKEAGPEEVKEFASRFAGMLQKNFPELAQQISAKAERLSSSDSMPRDGMVPRASIQVESSSNLTRDGFPQNAANTPIVPEANSNWRLVGIFAVVLVLALTFLLFARQ